MNSSIPSKCQDIFRLRIALIVPFVMLLCSLAVGVLSYNTAKVQLKEDLNEAVLNFASAKQALLAKTDTIKALRHLRQTVDQPLIYKASELAFHHDLLKEGTFFSLTLLEDRSVGGSENSTNGSGCGVKDSNADMGSGEKPLDKGYAIVSDSILILPQGVADGVAIELRGYSDCSMASVFLCSDQRVSAILFALAMLWMTMVVFVRRRSPGSDAELTEDGNVDGGGFQSQFALSLSVLPTNSVDPADKENNCDDFTQQDSRSGFALDIKALKLTPMQRKLVTMLAENEDHRLEKYDICQRLWGDKYNAEESLYTLVRRTKLALADSGIEIVCNRGESYELRVSR